jgi:hypothetical protein
VRTRQPDARDWAKPSAPRVGAIVSSARSSSIVSKRSACAGTRWLGQHRNALAPDAPAQSVARVRSRSLAAPVRAFRHDCSGTKPGAWRPSVTATTRVRK